MSTDSDRVSGGGRPGKRERLVAAASELIYRQGIAGTTLANLAHEADVPLGNVYYYFKTKDDIIRAVLQAHAAQLEAILAELTQWHRTPKARLKALVDVLTERADEAAKYGCPYGTLCSELAKRPEGADPLAAPLLRIQLDWAEQQFRALGRRDARELAVDLIAAYEGSAVLANALGRTELMTRQGRRLHRWIDAVRA